MSLKAIKELVELLAEDPAENLATLLAARDEIAALEKAAHMVTNVGQSEAAADRYPEWVAACELLRSIAKEAMRGSAMEAK